LEPEKRIIDEPSFLIREAARGALKGKLPLVTIAAAIYMLCLTLPVLVVEQITGLWGFWERATDDYLAMMSNNPTPASIYEWAGSYGEQGGLSLATWLYLILIPGPLTLGLSAVWLRIIRGHQVFADMVMSGFGNFLRAFLLHLIRTFFMALWAILFVIPGFIAYYRYSLAFFLLVDNPDMSPIVAINLSKYYMRGNKGSRFYLDLTFIGWFIIAGIALSLIGGLAADIIAAAVYEPTFFINQLVMSILGAFILAPVFAYRGVAAAEYYHRVICRDPRGFEDPLQLPETR